MNSSIWSIDVALTDTATPGLDGSENNGNQGVPYIAQNPELVPHDKI